MLDDQSKKFIKDVIENAIDRKFDEQDKKTPAKQRLEDLRYEKRTLEDRKKLLAELQERDKKGENTIAQKFEMMNLAITNAIPQDVTQGLKDAYSSGAKTIKSGANQLGAGLSHLTERAMLSNPITAFLYSNRDILGALGNVGLGAAKMGFGAIKGVGQGALSLANSAFNMFKRSKQDDKDDEEETEEAQLPKLNLFSDKEEPSFTEKISGEKDNWRKQINEIHSVVTKDLIKQQKSSTNILSKGLQGLSGTMKAIQGFTDMIVAKQKLILGGVLLGAVAILALAKWFKSGGLQELITDAVNNKISEMAPNRNKQSKVQAENNLDTQISLLKTNADDMQNAQVSKIDGLYDKGGKEQAWKKQVMSTAKSANLQNVLTTSNNGIAYTTFTVGEKKKGKTADFRVPVTCSLFEVGLDGSWIKLLRKFEDKDKDRGWNRAPVIVIDNVKEIHVKAGEDIPANKKIATVNYPYHIYGDYDSFIKKDGKSYQDAMFTEEAMQAMAKQYNETQDSVYKNVGGLDHHIDKELDTKAGNRKEADVDYIKNRINGGKRFEGMNEDKMFLKPSQTQNTTTTNTNNPQDNQNRQKAQEQQQKINEQQKQNQQQKTDKKADAQTTNDKVASINFNNSSTTPYRYADLLNTGEYNNMVNEDIIT